MMHSISVLANNRIVNRSFVTSNRYCVHGEGF